MRALLLYPEYPETFWNFKFALKFISKKAVYPPLGLLTVAALFPKDWELKLIDMNVTRLNDEDLRWADLVCISAMSIQEQSMRSVIARCRELGVKMVAGGPLVTSNPEDFADIDYLVLNEAEITLPMFIKDLADGCPKHVYSTTQWADMATSPIPRWDLIDMRRYVSMATQFSRGCPYDCEFCNITSLFGRAPRSKSKEQVVMELDRLYLAGWRGGVFFVDDNFIGDKPKVKKDILPAIIDWTRRRKHVFAFNSQVSLNLADDPDLLNQMTDAGFESVFVGIESPNEESLVECNKTPNKNRDLMGSVSILQKAGMEVQAGFIVGFDSDPPTVFDRLVTFIQESGIVTAMVGLLNAPHGTKLYKRLMSEGRLTRGSTGDNTDSTLNFIPKMNPDALLEGYQRIVERIYSPNTYYHRIKQFLQNYKPRERRSRGFELSHIVTAIKTSFVLGVLEKERSYYWRLLLWSLVHKPKLCVMAMTYAAYGFHFRKSFEQHRAG